MNNSLANQEKYDIIENSAKKRYKEALEAVHSRLLKWAGLSSYQFRKSEYREKIPEWLNEKKEEEKPAGLFNILISFRRVMGVKDQDQVGNGWLRIKDATGNITASLTNKPGIRNWQCGMYQMIDTQNKAICEVLPVLLTAYVYNFPDNDLVHHFLARNPLESGLENREKYIYGVERYPNPNLNKAIGFERLMFEMATDCPEDRKMIEDISKLFRFRDFSSYLIDSGQTIFFLPNRIRSDFIKSCTRSYHYHGNNVKAFLHKPVLVPQGFEFYDYRTLLEIFAYFYNYAKKEESFFAKPSNPLFCWILINQEIRNSIEMDCIRKNCNTNSKQTLDEHYDNHIRELYIKRPKKIKSEANFDVITEPPEYLVKRRTKTGKSRGQ